MYSTFKDMESLNPQNGSIFVAQISYLSPITSMWQSQELNPGYLTIAVSPLQVLVGLLPSHLDGPSGASHIPKQTHSPCFPAPVPFPRCWGRHLWPVLSVYQFRSSLQLCYNKAVILLHSHPAHGLHSKVNMLRG